MATFTSDAFIYGGGMPGILAARRLADAGFNVTIAEWTKFPGGLTTGGLGLVDYVANTAWGLTKQFFQMVEQAAIADGAVEDTGLVDISGVQIGYGRHPNGLIRRVLPNWAVTARDLMMAPGNIKFVNDIELAAVNVDPDTLLATSVVLTNQDVYNARVFMDASYEGDLLRLIGVPLDYGRNSIASFNEVNAGYRADHYASSTSQRRVNAQGNLWKGYTMPPRDEITGKADAKTQGFDYRMTMSTEPNRRPFIPPPGYRVKDFVDWIDEINLRNLSTIEAINSYQSATPTLHTTNGADWHGRAWRYPRCYDKASRVREQIAYYTRHMGLFYTAMTDSRVPQAMRDSVAAHGLPANHNTNEYIGTPGWSSALYTREVNRMRTEDMMTFADMKEPFRQSKPDPIAIAGYNADRHYVNYFPTPTGGFHAEGGLDDTGRRYYQIPFSACRPSLKHCRNVVTPITLAGTSVLIASVRMEPTYMVIGDALGLAMVAALQQNVPVGQLQYGALRERLVDAGAVITY